MRLARSLRNLFLPRESNNHKAKLLHPSSFLALKLGLIGIQLVINFAAFSGLPGILGYAANIPPSEVIRLTNEKRVAAGLNPLTENAVLSQAAQAKGADMLNKDYWAHVSPDGIQPWAFFSNAGYKYRYAGENLARDFSNPSSAVDAWMASPTHKDNLLSGKYKEVGIAVIEGDLNGVDTTIIVQFFGTRYGDTLPVEPVAQAPVATLAPTVAPLAAVVPEAPTPLPTVVPSPTPVATPEFAIASAPIEGVQNQGVLISPFSATKGASLVVVGLLLVVMVVDAAVTSRRRIRRIGGRTFAHLSFLGMILAIIIILRAGQIL